MAAHWCHWLIIFITPIRHIAYVAGIFTLSRSIRHFFTTPSRHLSPFSLFIIYAFGHYFTLLRRFLMPVSFTAFISLYHRRQYFIDWYHWLRHAAIGNDFAAIRHLSFFTMLWLPHYISHDIISLLYITCYHFFLSPRHWWHHWLVIAIISHFMPDFRHAIFFISLGCWCRHAIFSRHTPFSLRFHIFLLLHFSLFSFEYFLFFIFLSLLSIIVSLLCFITTSFLFDIIASLLRLVSLSHCHFHHFLSFIKHYWILRHYFTLSLILMPLSSFHVFHAFTFIGCLPFSFSYFHYAPDIISAIIFAITIVIYYAVIIISLIRRYHWCRRCRLSFHIDCQPHTSSSPLSLITIFHWLRHYYRLLSLLVYHDDAAPLLRFHFIIDYASGAIDYYQYRHCHYAIDINISHYQYFLAPDWAGLLLLNTPPLRHFWWLIDAASLALLGLLRRIVDTCHCLSQLH